MRPPSSACSRVRFAPSAPNRTREPGRPGSAECPRTRFRALVPSRARAGAPAIRSTRAAARRRPEPRAAIVGGMDMRIARPLRSGGRIPAGARRPIRDGRGSA
jgi:hypothetical protein